MAGPITHTVFAEKTLASLFSDKDRDQFIIGNLFPDIRTLGVISREETHQKGLALADVQAEPDPFRAGVLFHSLVDEIRERYVREHGAYHELPQSYLTTVALKVCEDTILYHYSTQWPTYAACLDAVLPQERAYHIAPDKLRHWHQLHQGLFTGTIIENKKFFFALGLDETQVAELTELVHTITVRKVVDSYVDALYQDLEHIISQ